MSRPLICIKARVTGVGQARSMDRLDAGLTARALTACASRYTSYPPATHFSDAVGPETMRDRPTEVPARPRISLCVRIPFCRRLCWFCASRIQGTGTEAPLAPYLDALEAEIPLVAAALPGGITVEQMHVGGGTPTFPPPDLMRRLFAMIAATMPRAPTRHADEGRDHAGEPWRTGFRPSRAECHRPAAKLHARPDRARGLRACAPGLEAAGNDPRG
ncbi:hypothetical protein [uncultured Jannaschia sp.]|uniref:hypothetical protein n=1 Tax=uncultured Jannaschia sp. TaxID=293347 RepID=UPI00260948FD|nr:hypothetical protein [uncultured Jannaschia sp.]